MSAWQLGDVAVAGGALLQRMDFPHHWASEPAWRWAILGPDTTWKSQGDPADGILVARLIPGTLRLRPVLDLEFGQIAAIEPRTA